MATGQTDELDIDMLSPSTIDDPYSVYAFLRDNDPAHWSPRHRAWFLTRHEDVSAAFRDKRFSADRISGFIKAKLSGPDADPDVVATFNVLADWMVFKDGDGHQRLRRLVRKAFTPRAIDQLKDSIIEQSGVLLDQMEAGGTSADFVESFSYPLTATVVADLLGVPRSDLDQFKLWSDQLNTLVSGNQGDADRYHNASQGMQQFVRYLGGLLDHYRDNPEENLLSAMAAAREEGDALSKEEVVATAVLILFAGHETTTNLLGNFVWALTRFPEQQAVIIDGTADMGRVVEEIMRLEGPARADIRVLAEDVEIHGKIMKAGQRVILCMGGANRDPAVFERPDELVFDRARNQHIGFGLGAHYCLGAPLARLEATEAVPMVMRRLADLRVDPTREARWHVGLLNRGFEYLPVEWGPRS